MFLVSGESLIDLVAEPSGSYTPVAGGAPYNFARALALQGVSTAYLNPLSSDSFGRLLHTTLLASGAMHLGVLSQKPTSLALVATDAQGQPQYSFYRQGVADRDIELAQLTQHDDVTAFHSGGLALVPPDNKLIEAALRYHRSKGTLCSIDVNLRPQVAQSMAVGAEQYQQAALRAAALADIVKVSDEDLRHLARGDDARAAGRELLGAGCTLVVLTLGAQGAWLLSREHETFAPAPRVRLVDSVGAGDCFYAGFIAALLRSNALRSLATTLPSRSQLQHALRHASACAALNLARKGCAPATWEEAQEHVNSLQYREEE